MFELTIQLPHSERRLDISPSASRRMLTDVLRGAGLELNTRCGLRGLCSGCLVELLDGQLEDGHGAPLGLAQGEVCAVRGCEVCVPLEGAARIHVPLRSLLAHQPQVVTSFRLNVPRAHDPVWQNIRFGVNELSPDVPRETAIREYVAAQLETDQPLVIDGEAGSWEPDADGDFDLALEDRGDHRLLRRSSVARPAHGVAIDVGTTTVVVILVDLASGDVVASASGLNAQARLGDNVLTRINLCMREPQLTRRMQQAIVRSTIRPLLKQVLRDSGVRVAQLASVVVAGNTTMLHLLHGVDPSSLGVAPFTPVFLEHRVVEAESLHLTMWDGQRSRSSDTLSPRRAPAARLPGRTLPGAAAYVGADITAGVLASGMVYSDATSLLVDLGTNGEIVLAHRGRLLGCATAAGPAFEGAGLTFGMRAGHGAVGHIWLDDGASHPRLEVIGDGRPVGLCGTAYIDFVARARCRGLISTTARFAQDAAGIIRHPTHGWSYVVAPESDAAPQVLITEADMASLLQAKGAIAAGVTCLLRRANIRPDQVDKVYLAGGFGFHMHVDSLLGCGMLPGFQLDQVELVGNTSLAGAYLTLVDSSALGELRQLSQRLEIIELNLEPDFEAIYIDQLWLPT